MLGRSPELNPSVEKETINTGFMSGAVEAAGKLPKEAMASAVAGIKTIRMEISNKKER